ncbi:hypothetical protein HNP46_000156 [Pseudomonas nitritireducens]|uniref:Uncharacterized protein n=1 Tax=Pseudomonas nitroreducens TaxID=46680 RepID=A0A7W7KF26_PSENT|nr:hypothetical protein [Pseudomonas nitritireducens]MBB4861345.1 hypothetical protein [Pseudomonas nitritireducens]
MQDEQQKKELYPKLLAEAAKLYKHFTTRYNIKLVEDQLGVSNTYLPNLVAELVFAGITLETLIQLREWMGTGLAPFVKFPPSMETVVQLAGTVQCYPYNEYAKSVRQAWAHVDVKFGVCYARWKTEMSIESLVRERVWIADLESMSATPEEIRQAEHAITNCPTFRVFAPNSTQFLDAVQASRRGVPIIEEAWFSAISAHSGTDLHPLVRKAIGRAGGFEKRENGKSTRELEERFKAMYRTWLYDGSSLEEPRSEVQEEDTDRQASKEEILSIFGKGR